MPPTKTASIRALAEPLNSLYLHLSLGEHNVRTLARALRVSTATCARWLRRLRPALRSRGEELVSVRSRGRWHYDVVFAGPDPFTAGFGSVREWRRPTRGTDDDLIYG